MSFFVFFNNRKKHEPEDPKSLPEDLAEENLRNEGDSADAVLRGS